MLQDVFNIIRSNPQIAVFLAIAIGYFIGKVKIFGFNIGSTAGVLVAALVLGQIDIDVPPLLKAVGFALFIFTIGYKVGPQFFGALKKEGLNYIWISLVVAFTGLGMAILLGKIFGFDKGITAGLLGGAMTQSSVIGTADGAIKHLAVSAADNPPEKPPGRVRLWIGAGLEQGASVATLRDLILGATGEPEASIGKIDVRERHAFAEIPGDRAASFVSRLKRTEFAGKRIKVKLA